MRVLSWNIQGNNGIGAKRFHRVVNAIADDGADLVLLQEVAWRGGLHERLRDALAEMGFVGFAYSGVVGSADKRYGNVTVARWPVTQVHGLDDAPWPQSLLTTVVESPVGEVEVTNAHIPNGSGNGWAKIDTLEALAQRLEASERIRLLGGDFNEPRSVYPDGAILPFGTRQRTDGSWTSDGAFTGTCGQRHPRRRWHDAVVRVLGVDAPHGLVHAARATGVPELFGPTHVVRKQERSFDHLFVDRRRRVIESGTHHDWRTNGPSDHSAVFALIG